MYRIGAGGIGFDVADFLSHPHDEHTSHPSGTGPDPTINKELITDFLDTWGVDPAITNGGLIPKGGKSASASQTTKSSGRKLYLLQRKEGKLGSTLGKTTGWIHRTTLKMRGVEELDGCKYIEINDNGLVIERKGKQSVLDVDTIVMCAGQEPFRDLYAPLEAMGKKVFLVGGAHEAGELGM